LGVRRFAAAAEYARQPRHSNEGSFANELFSILAKTQTQRDGHAKRHLLWNHVTHGHPGANHPVRGEIAMTLNVSSANARHVGAEAKREDSNSLWNQLT
jgi:hypothetical protein